MRDVFNFSAGPSMLPEEVLLSVQKDFANYNGSGMCVAEMSHRCKWYDEIHEEALALIKELMNISDDYYVLFVQGGASTQFEAVPLNLLTEETGKKADYERVLDLFINCEIQNYICLCRLELGELYTGCEKHSARSCGRWGIVIFVGKIYNLANACLNNSLCTFVAGE